MKKQTKFQCPHCGSEINPAALLGARGGAVKGAVKAREPSVARAAAFARWGKRRRAKPKSA